MNARRPDQRTAEAHQWDISLVCSHQVRGWNLLDQVTGILAELVSRGLGFHHETQLPERILQSEDDRCVMVGCFAVGGASVEAYIRMLGCTLTIESASQMNWTVGDRKISMNNNKKN
ncbi:hypothetical protein G5714_023012 [Onychostoma macrolepis]|uniref:Uncharacterized protein n=1 Tax=Onychostoma macrolepis TaxID=369639 RepID=A0A7J6BRF4_9TELE|nr:hypothetical protein G5714_023012 [Onychostoma macrolepis]